MRRRYDTSLLIIGLLIPISIFPNLSVAISTNELKQGPFIDKIVYDVIANQDQRILELQNGEIEMDTSFFDPVYLPTIEADSEIDVHTTLRNGYGHLTINCQKYPLNISGLRRAMAYAIDKTELGLDYFDGFSQDHDSLVPYINDFCIEDDLDWHYYAPQPAIGNAILDDLGFTINSTTGFRQAPNGSAFDVVIEYSSSGYAWPLAQSGVDALTSLHIDAKTQAVSITQTLSKLDNHEDYDIVFYGVNFPDSSVEWLADEYWSENADVFGKNPTNFRNATYDSWREQLLNGTSYEEVYEAAAEMQKILHYNVPRIVIYQNIYLQAYRNDQFTGHVSDIYEGIAGSWTMRNIHQIEGGYGGTVDVAISQEPDSFNVFVTNSQYSKLILDKLYSSLYDRDPSGNPIGDLANALVIETHEDNVAIPIGHTQFTIDIIQNATWTDGVPLTAYDVAFTYNYMMNGNITDKFDSESVYGVWAPTPYQVVFEYSTESYWHFSDFAYTWIIPKHIFNNETGIGYDGWTTWNPALDPDDPLVTSGPFMLTDL
ncbi:MAG: ABC transporter substrate-binding protein, partial [Candidatus Thorarchaeota archaeon]